MPVLQEQWLSSPRAVIAELFERAASEGGGGGELQEDGCWGITKYFESKLKNEEELAGIPSLNGTPLSMLHDGCLVQYRAMVQDQFDPDFYFKVYHVKDEGEQVVAQCGMYSDFTQEPVDWDHPSNVMADRQTFYCVPVPAETPWVKQSDAKIVSMETPTSGRSHLKRKYSSEDSGMHEECSSMEVGVAGEASAGTFQAKKPCFEPATTAITSTANKSTANTCTANTCPADTCTGGAPSQGFDLNFPLPGEDGLPCLVKVYGESEACKVGSVVHVVGVLSVDPTLAPLAYSETGFGDTVEENRVHCPPPALVPRLHAITIRVLPHTNPLLPAHLPLPVTSQDVTRILPTPGALLACRTKLVKMLTQICLGDSLAAEYILLHLLSSVYGRMEMMALGKYSLNLSRSPGTTLTDSLYQFFQLLLTKCFLLPMTLDTMNAWRFSPKKDYTSNRLLSAVLQLSPGTHMLVDETVLTAGQLTQVGVANLTALGNLIQWQKVTYDFQFHSTEFNCDVPVLILSEGKSILKVDCHVPLEPSATPSASDTPAALSDITAELRQYLTLCRNLDYTLTPAMKVNLEEEFVRLRGCDPELSPERFHHLLSTGRLVAVSHGSTSLTPALWNHTCTLENNRLQRLKNTG